MRCSAPALRIFVMPPSIEKVRPDSSIDESVYVRASRTSRGSAMAPAPTTSTDNATTPSAKAALTAPSTSTLAAIVPTAEMIAGVAVATPARKFSIPAMRSASSPG